MIRDGVPELFDRAVGGDFDGWSDSGRGHTLELRPGIVVTIDDSGDLLDISVDIDCGLRCRLCGLNGVGAGAGGFTLSGLAGGGGSRSPTPLCRRRRGTGRDWNAWLAPCSSAGWRTPILPSR